MLTYSVRRSLLSGQFSMFKTLNHMCSAVYVQLDRGRCDKSGGETKEEAEAVLALCADRGYIRHADSESWRRGVSSGFGPLGAELKRNLLEKWWDSVVSSRAHVFGISSPSCSPDKTGSGHVKKIDTKQIMQILEQPELSREQIIKQVNSFLRTSQALRTNFFQGALEQFVPSSELVNRKLPFGLAEHGLCFRGPSCGWPDTVTKTSLVWFCSPRTSSQWLDFWARQRLQWWKKFALSSSDFSSRDVPGEDLHLPASRGVKIMYNFPWGPESLEILWSRGDTELLQAHNGARSKLHCRDGQKSVPHVITVTANMDQGVMAFLFNSLQQQKKEGSKRKLHQKVLKLHPVLTPIKVALDIGRGSTMELRQVCEGLLQELLDSKISVWPGYLETMPMSLEQLNARYDEMGVLFTTVINENTLENGLLRVRSRDTTVRETMHISEIKNFLSGYVSAAQHT
ncbi:DNA polymerase subunit gamma-2, mitochondrial [Periophthalmus magnuspinnatus]|uniref:DNA polymerase subunit gamma-2, mitochondrial n=1 Tax=Periophthalmus magnuspinnatus TaxID=409849 RepID=UPI00145A83CB|nr:DNA polymerase subunit gamma-2, mitochondrial [Periophthalmus magnuspinnatus]